MVRPDAWAYLLMPFLITLGKAPELSELIIIPDS